MNLVFNNNFKENAYYKCIFAKAIQVVNYFYKSSYFIRNLKDKQTWIYNKIVSLLLFEDTR